MGAYRAFEGVEDMEDVPRFPKPGRVPDVAAIEAEAFKVTRRVERKIARERETVRPKKAA